MDGPTHWRWLYTRFLSGRKWHRQEFLEKVKLFEQFARSRMKFTNNGHYRCLCVKCQNRAYKVPDNVKLHLYQNSFHKGYWYWPSNGKPREYGNVGNGNPQNLYEHMVSGFMYFDNSELFMNHVGAMVNDAMIVNEVNAHEQPNTQAHAFYDMLEVAQRPL